MSTEPNTQIKLKGSCHCQKITYTFLASPKPSTGKFHATRCNCTFCTKTSATNYNTSPADFVLLTPSAEEGGKSSLSYYGAPKQPVRRYFCSKCGVHCWMEGSYEHEGQKIDIFAVNFAAVDQPQEGLDLSEVKLGYYDLLANNIAGGLKDSPWKGGLL